MVKASPSTSSNIYPNEWTNLQTNNGTMFNKIKTPWFMYMFTFLAALGGFLFGYDTGIISGAIILIRQDFRLNTSWQEIMVASTIGAAAIFALVGGYLSDKVGRKPVILLASVIFTSGSLCMGCAEDKYMLLVGRIIVGTAIGLSSMTIPMYIAESAPAESRGRLVSVNIVMVAGGQFISNLIAGLFSFKEDGWRYMFGVAAIPSIIQFVAFMFMPESPRWLIIKNRHNEAREVLRRLRGEDRDIDEEYDSIRTSILSVIDEAKHREHKMVLLRMVQTPSVIRALIVGCGLQMIQQLAGINTVMYYSATIITMAGVRNSKAAIWLSALTSSVNFLFTMVGVYLVEKMGRRPLTLLSLVGAIISLACLGAGFQLESINSPAITYDELPNTTCSEYRTCGSCRMDINCGYCYIDIGNDGVTNGSCLPTSPDDWLRSLDGRCDTYKLSAIDPSLVWAYDFCPTQYYWLPMLGLVMYLVFFAPGMGPMPWTINAEIYPHWARGAANGASTFTNWLFNLLCSITFLSLTESIGAHGTFWIYLGFSVVGLFFLIFTLPETKGKDLEEIEGIFAAPWFSKETSFQPYNKKESLFNYVHIDTGRVSEFIGLGLDNTSASKEPDIQVTRLGGKSPLPDSNEVIDTRLCTNRDQSSEEESDDSEESTDTNN